jgi:thiol-disulfide isomerase/thioredoxin
VNPAVSQHFIGFGLQKIRHFLGPLSNSGSNLKDPAQAVIDNKEKADGKSCVAAKEATAANVKKEVVVVEPAEKVSTFFGVRPGVDVMITIFCDFCQFLAEKLAFFSKSNVMITLL